MTKLKGTEIRNRDNILVVWRHKPFSLIIFHRKYIDPYYSTKKGDIVLRSFKIWRHMDAPHLFFQLTDEEVERMILPRII